MVSVKNCSINVVKACQNVAFPIWFQDYVGEAPIHKAARAGNMECINVLLVQGAKPG